MISKLSKKTIIIFIVFIVAVLFLIFAYYAYPVPGGDSQFYIVPAIQFAKSGLLISSLFPSGWEIDKLIDQTGAKRFLFYPPLFPLVLSRLMPEASSWGAFMGVAFINIIVLSLGALLFYKVINQKGHITWFRVFVIALALFALAASLAETGRPEVLARVWIVVAALVPFFAIAKKYDWLFYGLLLGLMGATHPAGSIFFLLALGIAFGAIYKFKDVALRGGATLLIAFFVCLLAITLGPFGIKETIEGTFVNAVAVNYSLSFETGDWFTFLNLFNYYFVSQAAPFYGFVILLMLVAGFFFYFKYRSRLATPAVSIICAAVFIYIIGKMIYSGGHVFYISLFAPIIFSVFLYFFLEVGVFGKGLTLLVFALVATGFIRTGLLFPFFLKQEAGFNEARTQFADFVALASIGNKTRVGVSGGLWALSEEYGEMYVYNTWPEQPKEETAFVFFGQRYSGMLNPPEVVGCNLISNKFSEALPKMFGIKFANTMPGYGYAIYDCRG